MSPNAAAPPPLPPKTRKKAHVVSIRVSSAQAAPQVTASDTGCVRISVNRLPVGYYLYNGFKCADHIEDAVVAPSPAAAPPPPPPKTTSVRVTVNGEDNKRNADTRNGSDRNGFDNEPKKNGVVTEIMSRNGMVTELVKKTNGVEPEKNGVAAPQKNGAAEPEKNGVVVKNGSAEPEKNGFVIQNGVSGKIGVVAVREKNSVVDVPEKNGVVTPEKNCDEPEKSRVAAQEKNGFNGVSEKIAVVAVQEKIGVLREKNGVVASSGKNGIVQAEKRNGFAEKKNGLRESKKSPEVSPTSTMNSANRRSSPKVVEERTYEERTAPVAAVTYDADHYYDFHLHEAQPASEEQPNEDEDYFAGCRSFGLQESSIKSSKGTVRGVKNRVRAGVATFLQMQATQVSFFFYPLINPVRVIH